jgi:predicted DNA-binding transcriptional regulator AlpA
MDNFPDLLDINGVCEFWGGNRPVSRASVYRQIAKGEHPKPMKNGMLSRWDMGELVAERARRMAARHRALVDC